MADRENVTKALECRLDINDSKYKHCLNCDYRHDIDHLQWACQTDGILEDALALLKAQEPRVMTLSGVRNLKESTPIWLEDVDKKDVIGALFMRDYSGTKCVDFAIARDWEHERVTADYMDYGIRWRVWTSRPTDEQRQAVKWG